MDSTVNLTPVLQWVLSIVTPLVGALAIYYFQKMTGIKLNQQASDTIEKAMTNGIALATSRLAPNGLTVDVKNQVVADAANYVLAHAPDAAKKFGLDLDPAKLTEKIEARLVQTPAAAPVSPATAAPVPVPVVVPAAPAA